MLAATRARPPATRYSPTPAGDRLVAAFAAEGGGALGHEPLAAPGDGRGRRLAGAFGGELAAGGADLLAAVAPDRRLRSRLRGGSPRSAR